jgi:hypothetical protein
MLPMPVVELVDKFIKAYDHEHEIGAALVDMFYRAAERIFDEKPSPGSLLYQYANDAVAFVEVRTTFVWERLKECILSTDLDWYPELASDLTAQVDAWTAPVAELVLTKVRKVSSAESSVALEQAETRLRTMVMKQHALIALFAATHEGTTKRRKQTVMPNVTYNLNGPNPRVNIDSTDFSINISNSEQIFAELRKAISSGIQDEKLRSELVVKAGELEAAVGKSGFLKRYSDFVESAANHMTVLGPFIPMLTKFLPQ